MSHFVKLRVSIKICSKIQDTRFAPNPLRIEMAVSVLLAIVADAASNRLRAFFPITQSVHIAAGCSEDIEISFLPFSPGGYQCALILSDDSVGELLYLINGTAQLPLPEEILMLDNSSGKMQILCSYRMHIFHY